MDDGQAVSKQRNSVHIAMRRGLCSVLVPLISVCLLQQGDAARSCPAKCSPHITLPCSFGSLDRCLEDTCRDLCWKDGYRKMIGCYCRGSAEGPTLRSCFCGPSKYKNTPKKVLF